MDQTQTMLVPTTRIKPTRELDIGRMSESDLQSLRQTDPFMYHSIPAVRRANLSLKSTDPSQVASSLASGASRSSAVVRRKSQLSTECHESLILKDLLDDEEFVPREFQVPTCLATLFGGPSGASESHVIEEDEEFVPPEFEVPPDPTALFGGPSSGSERKRKR